MTKKLADLPASGSRDITLADMRRAWACVAGNKWLWWVSWNNAVMQWNAGEYDLAYYWTSGIR